MKHTAGFYEKYVKRFFDLTLSLTALIVLSPILLITALMVRIKLGSPVIFKQPRPGKDGKIFHMYKFRSMLNAEVNGVPLPDEQRLTPFGRALRATSLDELPELVNILKGDMSIVGPRPERVEHVEEYTNQIPEFKYRLKVKGGLTGYAQIYGKYNTSAYDKLRMDLMYIENYSLALDIKLILTTIRIMFQKESTEGFEKQKENEKLIEELIEKTKQDQEK